MSEEEVTTNTASDDDAGSYTGSYTGSVGVNSSTRSIQSGSASSLGEVYIRADGKKVRRVKRSQKQAKKKKTTTDSPDDVKPSLPPLSPTKQSRAGGEREVDSAAKLPAQEDASSPHKASPAISTEMLGEHEEPKSETKPASEQPAESKPAEPQPEESKPAESQPEESKPAEPQPEQFKPKDVAGEEASSVAPSTAETGDEEKPNPSPKTLEENADSLVVAASFKALDNLIGAQKEDDDEQSEKANPWDANNLPEDKNPWLSAPSFEDNQSLKSAISVKSSKTTAPPDPFETLFAPTQEEEKKPAVSRPTTPAPEESQVQPAPAPEEQPQEPSPAPTTSMPATSSSSISYTYSLPPVDEFFDPIAAMANSATKAVLQVEPIESEESLGLGSSVPRFVETPISSPRKPTEQFKDEHDPHSDAESQQEGGPLWEAASVAASEAMSQLSEDRRMSKVPEAIRAKTRSRADIGSKSYQDIVGASSMYSGHRGMSGQNMHQMNPADDAYIFNATLAKKRVRVVQLLVFGLLGFLIAFLGSFYVQSTCNFAAAEVYVGANNEVFTLRYGLWKYTPIDSAFQGYSYCANYDDSYTSDSPIIPRISGISALVFGSYSLVVLWFYLVAGRASYKFWMAAVGSACLAGVGQSITYVFFAGTVCTRNVCSFGPGAAMGVFSTIMWFLLSFEMYFNMPISVMETYVSPGGAEANLVGNLDGGDFSRSMTAYIQRLSFSKQDKLPTLNEYRRRNYDGSVGGHMMELHSIKVGSYKPPAFADTYEL